MKRTEEEIRRDIRLAQEEINRDCRCAYDHEVYRELVDRLHAVQLELLRLIDPANPSLIRYDAQRKAS